jgi:hypothetical protein
MGNKTLLTIIGEVWYFIGLLICWLVIWAVSGLHIDSWQGIVLFIAILILVFIGRIKDFIDEKIKEKFNGK